MRARLCAVALFAFACASSAAADVVVHLSWGLFPGTGSTRPGSNGTIFKIDPENQFADELWTDVAAFNETWEFVVAWVGDGSRGADGMFKTLKLLASHPAVRISTKYLDDYTFDRFRTYESSCNLPLDSFGSVEGMTVPEIEAFWATQKVVILLREKATCKLYRISETRGGQDIQGIYALDSLTIDTSALPAPTSNRVTAWLRTESRTATVGAYLVDAEHSPGETVAGVAVTCTTDGREEGVFCTVCGKAISGGATIPALGHIEYTSKEAAAATCATAGNTVETSCSRCHEVLTASTTIPALGHVNYISKPSAAATCTTHGHTIEYTCSRCHTVTTASKTIAALGHALYESAPAVAATCTAAGSTAEISCSRCHEVITPAAAVDALGHVPTTSKAAIEPTCTSAGRTAETSCSRCHVVLVASSTIAALGHDLYVSRAAIAPTTKREGRTAETSCHRCGAVITASTVIPKLGGQYQYMVVDLSAGVAAADRITYLLSIPASGWTTEHKTTKLVLRWIPAGAYTSAAGSVTLSSGCWMGIFEVTQKQYELLMGSNPCSAASNGRGDMYPVYKVSYAMVRGSSTGSQWPASSDVNTLSFMGRLRALTDESAFDLPTEAQWEFACRAGTTTTYSYGDTADPSYMWYKENASSKTHIVGTKEANAYGLYDMHGNVWEYCLDYYGKQGTGTDPVGPTTGTARVARGGAWSYVADYCTSAKRSSLSPASTTSTHGFRVCSTLPAQENGGGEEEVDEVFPVLPDDATSEEIASVLVQMTDPRVVAAITDAASYERFREWTASITEADETILPEDIRDSATTWASYVLAQTTLLAQPIVGTDLSVAPIAPVAGSDNAFEFTLAIGSIELGQDVLLERLNDVFTIEACSDLAEAAGFTSDAVRIEFTSSENGVLRFTATPANPAATSFFLRVVPK